MRNDKEAPESALQALPTLLFYPVSRSSVLDLPIGPKIAETLTSRESIVSTTAVAFAAAPYNMRVWRWVHRTGLRIVDRRRWYGQGAMTVVLSGSAVLRRCCELVTTNGGALLPVPLSHEGF
jgi:hypothetical protein